MIVKEQEKSVIHVEIAIHPSTPAPLQQLSRQWQGFFEQQDCITSDVSTASQYLLSSLQGEVSIEVQQDQQQLSEDGTAAITAASTSVQPLPTSDCQFHVHTFQLSTEEAMVEELEPTGGDEEWTPACENLPLPHATLSGLWESLIFQGSVQRDLLEFSRSALLFADRAVSGHIVHWNRMLLLNGPPGTGKTSLCRALAQKLSIRMNDRFPRACLLEIHSHSLFSKWFSTSGKLVNRLFTMVRDMVQDDPDCLVCVLIDEIESLAGNRAGLTGEPSDALRAVNSLLTSLDRLRTFSNVLILATTNLTASVDPAFLDRADMKVYIGLPCCEARYEILRSCMHELVRVGIIRDIMEEEIASLSLLTPDLLQPYKEATTKETANSKSALLVSLAMKAEGCSGRSLRRLPLQAHALFVRKENVLMDEFLIGLSKAIDSELKAMHQIEADRSGS
jgi:hypothetical protein